MSKGRIALVGAVAVIAVAGYAALDAADVVPGVLTTEPAIPAPAAFPEPAPVEPADPGLAPPGADTAVPSPEQLAVLTDDLIADPRIGSRVGVSVVDGLTGEILVDVAAAEPRTPASSVKLLPALAALDALGADHVLTTRVVDDGARLTLVGGGDIRLTDAAPDTASEAGDGPDHPDGAGDVDGPDDPGGADDARASVGELARAAAEELRAQGRSEVTLALDDTLFTGPAYAPGWGGIDFDYVMAIQPIAIDSGRLASGGYAEDPALAAARAFASHLEAAGISVTGDITRDSASPDAEPIAEVTSAPLSALVRHTLRESDNSTSEVLARLVALAEGEEPSFAGAARAVRSRLAGMGLDVAGLELPDTSGLLVEVQATPGLLSDALLLGLEDPNFRAVIDGLPVAALNGTLRHRLDGPAAGVARAKTGTLTTAVSLSGVVLTADGRPLVFAVLADGVEFGGAAAGRAAIDEWVHHLATCGCR